MFILSTSQTGRICRRLILALLKSQTATNIKRLNYIKDYHLAADNKTILKTEEKILLISFDESKKDKLITLCDKQLGKDQRQEMEGINIEKIS